MPHLRGGTDNFFHYAAYLGRGANPFIVESDPNDAELPRPEPALPRGPAARPPGRPPRGCSKRSTTAPATADATAPRTSTPHYQRAFALLTSQEVATAFDIDAEPAAVRDRYGRHTFGQSALLARRLVEAGVTFVTVNCVPWDHHGTGHRLKTEDGARSC